MFEQTALQTTGIVGDLFADGESLRVLLGRLRVQSKFLVAVGDLSQRVGRAELRLDLQFLIGDLGLRHSDAADVSFEAPGDRLHLPRPLLAVNLVEIDQPHFVGGERLKNVIVRNDRVGLRQRDRRLKDSRMDRLVIDGHVRGIGTRGRC